MQSAVRSATSCVCSFARSCRVPARPVVLTRGFCHLWFLNEIFRCWQRQNFQKGLRQATAGRCCSLRHTVSKLAVGWIPVILPSRDDIWLQEREILAFCHLCAPRLEGSATIAVGRVVMSQRAGPRSTAPKSGGQSGFQLFSSESLRASV